MSQLYGPAPGAPPRLIPSQDLAGLATRDVEDRPVGELFGTLAEEQTGLIRYLDVSLTEGDRHVLVPIGHARVDRQAVPPRVRLRAATFEDLMAIPAYDPPDTPMDSDYQDDVLRAHGQLFYGSRYYAHPAFDHRGPLAETGTAEEAGAEPARESRLVPLSDLPDHRVARGASDIRGQPLEDERGERVGEVDELLVELAASKVRYVVVSLDEPSRQTLVPVGYLEIDGEAERTYTPELSESDIRVLPAYEPPLTRAAENRIQMALEGALTGDRYFQRPDFRIPAAG